MKKYFVLTMTLWLAFHAAAAEPVQTLDLKPFIGQSQIEKMGAQWLVPQGRQVLDGIPFQLDGTVLMPGTNTSKKGHPPRTSISLTNVPLRFERLHLLGAADNDKADDGVAVGNVHLFYADGSDAVLQLRFGEHLRGWQGRWHEAEPPLKSPDAREVWSRQFSAAAQWNKYVRLFHVTLANPSPDKDVRSIALESAHAQFGLLVVGLSVGPVAAEKLPDTVSAAKSPFPDVRERTGELGQVEGIVKSLDGKPLAGAHVRVIATRDLNTADRESATSDPVVGLTVETDAQGHFVLPGLPDNQLYRLLAAADGYEITMYRGADPKSDPIEVRLKPAKAAAEVGQYAVHGRVVGPDGQPLMFATVEPQGVETGGSTRWGGNESFPEEVFTGTNGEFTLVRKEKFDRLQAWIKYPGFAQTNAWLDLTNTITTVGLDVGDTIRGRVLKDGQPLAGVRVAVSGHERDMMVYAGKFEAKTGADGTFVIAHLQPDTSWDFYGIMSSFKKYGALPPHMEQTSGNGHTEDLGDLPVVRGTRLAGQVKTRSGEPLPDGVIVNVQYEEINEGQSMPVGKDGKFSFDGIGAKEIAVSCYKNGWRLSGANSSMDTWNPGRLIGQLLHDKEDLVIELERSEANRNFYYNSGNGNLPPQDQAMNRALWGAEPGGPPVIVLAGRVLDDQSGQPILNYKVLPGRQPPIRAALPAQKTLVQKIAEPFVKNKTVPWDERICWDYYRQETVSNGAFSEEFVALTSQPLLQIEAPGYAPLQTETISQSDTNLVLRLKKGVGPNGVVVQPDGEPAEGAILVQGASGEQFSLTGRSLGELGMNRNPVKTGKDGKFSLEAKTADVTVFVSHPTGWAQEPVPVGGGDGIKIRLKPWAALTGTLVDTNGAPVPGINLRLTMFHDWQRGGAAMVNLQHSAITDGQGHFTFTNVPPTRLEIQQMVPSFPGRPNNSWTYKMQTWLFVKPGITNDLGKVTLDQPPPEASMMDQVKAKLGL